MKPMRITPKGEWDMDDHPLQKDPIIMPEDKGMIEISLYHCIVTAGAIAWAVVAVYFFVLFVQQ
jgi:hypothetical protein